MPPWVLTQCEAQALNLDNKKSEINVIIEQKQSPISMNALGADMKTLMKDAKEVARRADDVAGGDAVWRRMVRAVLCCAKRA